MGSNEETGRRVGRPPGPMRYLSSFKKLRELAQAHAEEALETVVHIMKTSKDEWVQLACANIIFDRGYGKPREHVALEQQDVLAKKYQTIDEIKAELRAHGLPIDHLESPIKLIEHEPSS
jgi:esterase/lipase